MPMMPIFMAALPIVRVMTPSGRRRTPVHPLCRSSLAVMMLLVSRRSAGFASAMPVTVPPVHEQMNEGTREQQ